MVDLVFPPTIFRRLKEFTVFLNSATVVPSPGKIPGSGLYSQLLGSASIGKYNASAILIIGWYVNGKIETGGVSGDLIQATLEAIIRDSTVQPATTPNAIYSAFAGAYPNVLAGAAGVSDKGADSTSLNATIGPLSGGAAKESDNEVSFFAPSPGPFKKGDSLSLDVYLRLVNTGSVTKDPGTWTLDSFESTLDLLVYTPLPT